MSTWMMTREPEEGEAIRLLMARGGDKAFGGEACANRSSAFAQNPKKDRAASVRYPRKNTARIAVNMTIDKATKTSASIERGTASFAVPTSGSRMYMYQITRA